METIIQKQDVNMVAILKDASIPLLPQILKRQWVSLSMVRRRKSFLTARSWNTSHQQVCASSSPSCRIPRRRVVMSISRAFPMMSVQCSP